MPRIPAMQRRHDIDALRALAFALLILYHVGMYYVPGWDWHLKSEYTADWLRYPMRFLGLWRMDLIFLLSGVALAFLRRGRTVGELLGRRTGRLLLPLAFGMAVVVPVQPYVQGMANGLVEPGFLRFLARYYAGGPWPRGAFDGWEHGVTWNHLWYLPYLWMYTAILLLFSGFLKSISLKPKGPWLLTLPAMPFVLYSVLLQSQFPVTHDLVHDWYLHAVYFTAFLYGYCIATDAAFWAEAARLRHLALVVALGCFAAQLAFGGPVLRNFYLWTMIVAVLGYAHVHLNRPFRWLAWANESVYPWYVLHQSLILAIAAFVAPAHVGPVFEPLLIALGTLAGCWTATEMLIRPWPFMRPLFGLKAFTGKEPHVLPLPPHPAAPELRHGHDTQ